MATRKASQNALDALAPLLPEFFGGSADLTGSNLTNFKGCVKAGRDQPGNHLSYGVREFGMAAIMNGIALHGGYMPYGGTFLTFSDYSRNAIRMAALMKQRVIHVFTHDSIGLGEDGPTHQSVEHVPSLRLIPNLDVWRPADALETAVAWVGAVERSDGPDGAGLVAPEPARVVGDAARVAEIRRGGYVLRDARDARAVIVATGSEMSLALEAQAMLAAEGIAGARGLDALHQRLRPAGRRLAAPACCPGPARGGGGSRAPRLLAQVRGTPRRRGGHRRASASRRPRPALYEHFGITSPAVAAAVRRLLQVRA